MKQGCFLGSARVGGGKVAHQVTPLFFRRSRPGLDITDQDRLGIVPIGYSPSLWGHGHLWRVWFGLILEKLLPEQVLLIWAYFHQTKAICSHEQHLRWSSGHDFRYARGLPEYREPIKLTASQLVKLYEVHKRGRPGCMFNLFKVIILGYVLIVQ